MSRPFGGLVLFYMAKCTIVGPMQHVLIAACRTMRVTFVGEIIVLWFLTNGITEPA